MDQWIFGYGSMLWNPGFAPAETLTATLAGYQRSFCMLSIHHRGTETEPGLVLALDAVDGAVCDGVAFRVHPDQAGDVIAMLRERELISSAYLEREVTVALSDGREVQTVAFVIDPAHRQYCRFDLEMQAGMIARASGGRGPNTDYLFNTVAHLAILGISDPDLDWLNARVRVLTAANA